MKVLYADEIFNDPSVAGLAGSARQNAVNQAANDGHPIYLGVIDSVTYDAKFDRYLARFGRASSARIDTEVAQFLLQHANVTSDYGPSPTVTAHMEHGVVDSVNILFLSRT